MSGRRRGFISSVAPHLANDVAKSHWPAKEALHPIEWRASQFRSGRAIFPFLNLSGSLSFPVADVLRKRGIPFILVTSYSANGLTDGYRNEIALTKFYSVLDLENAIRSVVSVAEA